MTTPFAFECFADQEVFRFLKDDLHLPLSGIHSDTQGEVINDLLLRGLARIGMVDEDPLASHHNERDRMKVGSSHEDLEFRWAKRDGTTRHLVIVKPDLEECFLRSLKRLGLESELATDARKLHRLLGKRRTRAHSNFRADLKRLHDEGRKKNTPTFITRIEDHLRQILLPGN